MSVAAALDRLRALGAGERLGHALGGGLSVAVHVVAIMIAVVWSLREPPPEPSRPVIFVDLQPLVRKGRAPVEQELLPRLASAPPVEDRVHLGKAEKPKPPEPPKPKPPKPPDDERRRKEEERQRKKEERARRRRMRSALRAMTRGSKASDLDSLPVGRADGSELGTAQVGRLKATYVDRVGQVLRKEWKVSFIPEDELRHLWGKVRITSDRHGVVLDYAWARRSANAEWNGSVEACLKRFSSTGDKRLPPFPDERAFGSRFTYVMRFRK